MKVYRGFNKEIGPISYDDWIYVTEDPEQAKWYATKDGDIKDGAIIEYDMYDDLTFLSLEDVNERMEEYEDETYTIEDLLWYQEGLSDYLYNAGAGIEFEDPYTKGHMIYILFSDEYIKNGRILSKEEFDAIKPKVFEELNDILRIAGVKLNEELIHAEKTEWNEAGMAIVLKNPTKRELRENGLDRCRFICFTDGTWIFFDSMQWIHEHMLNQFSPVYGKGKAGGFYDLTNNEFIFIEPMDYDEGEEGYEEEFNYYIDKEQQFLLSYPYIVNTFGKNFNIMVYGDWVDNPW